MISSTELSHLSQAATAALTPAFDINPFQWLVTLGFPPNLAAAHLMPELFATDDRTAAINIDRVRRL